MKQGLLIFFLSLLFSRTFSQNLSGQWKGEFIEKSTSYNGFGGDKCEYVLDLDCSGQSVTGFSYTYFSDGGKRYYTICRLVGFIDAKRKYIEVKEVERTKTNVPVEVRNCFQIHKLTYYKSGDTETLEGNWIPAPDQDASCGHGLTSLTRRALKNSFPNFNSTANNPKTPTRTTPAKVSPVVKQPATANNNATAKQLTKSKAKPEDKPLLLSPNKDSFAKPETVLRPTVPKISLPGNFERRNNSVIKTIEVENSTVRVDLYDNGEIDGDSVSVFYNNKLLLSHKRLTEKPLTLTIDVDSDVNDLVMYAENLGTIPPNTALMVVTDGPNRYEVRITSDLQKNGAIRFVRRSKVTKQ